MGYEIDPETYEILTFRRSRNAVGEIEEYGRPVIVNVNDGVARWASNDRVPPADCFHSHGLDRIPAIDVAKSTQAREIDLDIFLADYRAANQTISDERIAGARAAHGPGVDLVDVITGKKFRT